MISVRDKMDNRVFSDDIAKEKELVIAKGGPIAYVVKPYLPMLVRRRSKREKSLPQKSRSVLYRISKKQMI